MTARSPISHQDSSKPTQAGIFRRLFALFYDLLLVTAVLFAISGIAVAANGGEATQHPLYYLVLVAAVAFFFASFWSIGGQTLGMRAWRIKVEGIDGSAISLKQALWRFAIAVVLTAPAAVGLLWLLFDQQRSTLYDRLAATQVIVLPR